MAQPTFRATIYSKTKAIIVTEPDYNQNRSAPIVVRIVILFKLENENKRVKILENLGISIYCIINLIKEDQIIYNGKLPQNKLC